MLISVFSDNVNLVHNKICDISFPIIAQLTRVFRYPSTFNWEALATCTLHWTQMADDSSGLNGR